MYTIPPEQIMRAKVLEEATELAKKRFKKPTHAQIHDIFERLLIGRDLKLIEGGKVTVH